MREQCVTSPDSKFSVLRARADDLAGFRCDSITGKCVACLGLHWVAGSAAAYSRRFGDLLVLRARYLTAPNTRAGEPHSASGKDLRLYTLCTYNIWAGSAVDCMLDNEMTVADGYYTLVVSDREHRPENLTAEGATWLDWGPYLDGQLTFRLVFRENALVAQIARGVTGAAVSTAVRPYVPQATHCDKATFEQGGWRACFGVNKLGVAE